MATYDEELRGIQESMKCGTCKWCDRLAMDKTEPCCTHIGGPIPVEQPGGTDPRCDRRVKIHHTGNHSA